MILSAQSIRFLCQDKLMIHPFFEREIAQGMTFGLSPAGYDIRLDQDITLPYGDKEGFIHNFILASSIEHFKMPTNVLGVVHDKSTLARQGLAIQNTIIEPGWAGYLTLELSYHKNEGEIKLLRGAPIAQVIFHYLDEATDRAYSGKYQSQKAGPQAAVFEDKAPQESIWEKLNDSWH